MDPNSHIFSIILIIANDRNLRKSVGRRKVIFVCDVSVTGRPVRAKFYFVLSNLPHSGFPQFPDSVNSASDLASFLVMRDSGDLPEFLDKFRFMTPQISGDPEALARVAFELCEDKNNEGGF